MQDASYCCADGRHSTTYDDNECVTSLDEDPVSFAGGCFAAGYLMHYHSRDTSVVGRGIPFAEGFAVVIQVRNCSPSLSSTGDGLAVELP